MKCSPRDRWKILIHALKTKKVSQTYETKSSFSFDLATFNKLESEEWWSYDLDGLDNDLFISNHPTRLPEQVLSFQKLTGFDNTGNICVWPSEFVLTYYCLCNKEFFRSLRVCEVAGGQTSLAGLAVSSCDRASHVLLTDGSEECVENIQRIIDRNRLQNVSCRLLRWDMAHTFADLYSSFDCVLLADCFFKEESHNDILHLVTTILKPGGLAIVMAPLRKNSLMNFLQSSRHLMTSCLHEKYDSRVWLRHLQYMQQDFSYNPDKHYPLLLTMKNRI